MIWNLSRSTDFDVALGLGPDDLDPPPPGGHPPPSSDWTAAAGQTSTPDPLSPGCKLYSFAVYTVVIGLLCVFGTVGNALTYLVFVKDKLKTSTSFLFQGISAIDNVLLLTVFPIYCIPPFIDYTNWYAGYYDFGFAIAIVYVYPLALISQTATVWATVLVAVNRYIAVCKPYQAARLCTVGQAKIQLSAVLVFSVLYNIPKFAESRLEVRLGSDNSTLLEPQNTALQENWWYLIIYGNIFYLIVMLILPLVTLTVLNIRLIRELKALRRKRAEMQQSVRQQQDNSVTLVLIVVILVFTFCQTPALATQILWNILADSARNCGGFQFFFSRVSNLLVVANSSVNFLVYYTFNARFRQVLGQTLCCYCGGGGGGGGGDGPGVNTGDYQAVRSVATGHKTTSTTAATVLVSGHSGEGLHHHTRSVGRGEEEEEEADSAADEGHSSVEF